MAWNHPVFNTDYRIVGYTAASTYTGSSSDIETYNSAVRASADGEADIAALGLRWKAIASTATVDAKDNIGTFTCPVFNCDNDVIEFYPGVDRQIWTDSTDMWSGGGLPVKIKYGFNIAVDGTPWMWTGTETDGTGISGEELGQANSWIGDIGAMDDQWIKWDLPGPIATSAQYHLGGVSETLRYVTGTISSDITSEAQRVIFDPLAVVQPDVVIGVRDAIEATSNRSIYVRDAGATNTIEGVVSSGLTVRG